MSDQTRAICDAVAQEPGRPLPAVVDSALALSQHLTKLVGGVALRSPLPENRTAPGAVAIVAAGLSLLASRVGRPLCLAADGADGGQVTVSISAAGARATEVASVARHLGQLADPTTRIDARGDTLLIALESPTA